MSFFAKAGITGGAPQAPAPVPVEALRPEAVVIPLPSAAPLPVQQPTEASVVKAPLWVPGDYRFAGAEGTQADKMVDSGIAPLVVAASGFVTLTDPIDLTDPTGDCDLPGHRSGQYGALMQSVKAPDGDVLAMPWHTTETVTTGSAPITWQYRPSHPRIGKDGDPNKYEFLYGRPTPIGVHPAIPRTWYDDAPTVLIAEGILKAYSALTAFLLAHGATRDDLSWHGVGDPAADLSDLLDAVPAEKRILILAVAGVGSWKSNPEWRSFRFKDRSTWWGVDGDVASNLNVHKASVEMFEFLAKKKHSKSVGLLAPSVDGGEKKVGIDDFLAKHGDWDDLVAMLTHELPPAPAKKKTGADKAKKAAAALVDATGALFGTIPDSAKCDDTLHLPLTHMGLAERVMAHYGDRLAYRPGIGRHVVNLDGRVWRVEDTKNPVFTCGLIRTVIRSITLEEAERAVEMNEEVQEAREGVSTARNGKEQAKAEEELEQAEKAARLPYERFGRTCENGQTAVLTVLSALKTTTVSEEHEWDTHPFLVNFPNGTVNIKHRDKNGWPAIRPHDPSDRITRMTAVDYIPGATSDDLTSVWEHMDQSGEGTAECIRRYLGYATTGAMDAKRMLNLWGAPNAAKSTIIEAAAKALGGNSDTSYVGTLSPGDLGIDPTNGAGTQVGLDSCRGARFIVIPEAEHAYLASDLVKRWTGGDAIRTRRLYSDGGPWKPTGKFILIGNGPSKFSPTDDGMINRAIIVEVQAIAADNIREGVKFRLEDTTAGQQAVLAMLVKAAADWYTDYKEGGTSAAGALLTPEHVIAGKAETLKAINPIADWLNARTRAVDEDEFERGDPERWVGAAPVSVWHELYVQDAPRLSLPKLKSSEFSKLLKAAGHAGSKQCDFVAGPVAFKGRIVEGLRYIGRKAWQEGMLNAGS